MSFLTTTQWKYRRAYLWVVTAFTMLIMVLALFFAELSLAQTVITMGFGALVSFVGTYVFGAVWDHFNARKAEEQEKPP